MPLFILDTDDGTSTPIDAAKLNARVSAGVIVDAIANETLLMALYTDADGVRSLRYFVPQSIHRNRERHEAYVCVWDAQRRGHRTFVLNRLHDPRADF